MVDRPLIGDVSLMNTNAPNSLPEGKLENLSLNKSEMRLLDDLDAAAESMVMTVKQWSQTNSGSTHYEGLQRMRPLLTDAFAPVEAELSWRELTPSQVVDAKGRTRAHEHPPALEVRQRPDAPIQIAMTGHYDTVFPADSPFQEWRMLDDDTLNGPGAADMKGGILVLAQALQALERHPKRDQIGYTVLLSPDEEIGNPASAPLLAELGQRAHLGMTYEPALADGGLAGARKGSGNFHLVVHGRAAHAGREHAKGRNAIAAAAQFVVALQSLNGRREGVTFNVGAVSGGGPLNMVPDLAVARFNVRLQSEEDQPWLEGEIARLVREIDALDGISAVLHGGVTRPPKPMSPQNARMFAWTKAAGAAVGVDVFWRDTGGVCEGNNLWAQGCPNVDTLGVRGGAIHTPDEFVILSSLPERAKLSAALLFAFADGRFDAAGARAP